MKHRILTTAAVLLSGGMLAAFSPPAVSCSDPEVKAQADQARPVARMSRLEYERTLHDLIGPDVFAALPALGGIIAAIPDDDRSTGFANINWTLTQSHLAGYLNAANEVGVQIARQPQLRASLVPCARDAANTSRKCVESFVESFGARAYRRPLERSERDALMDFHEDARSKAPATALSSLITRILVSPAFLLKQVPPSRPSLTCKEMRSDASFALASTLAFSLWGTMPDVRLFSAAKDGILLNPRKVGSEIDRMLGDGKARAWMRTFFRQWLHYGHYPVESYSWGFVANVGREHLHDDATEELDRFIETVVWEGNGTYADLMTSKTVVTSSLPVRRIYGLPDGRAGKTEQLGPGYAGVLTRAAMQIEGYDDASPVKRGARIRRQVLCDVLNSPDPSTLPPGSLVPPPPSHKMTTRERWEARTAPPMCQGCHRQINPLGFALEVYDGIGRFRTTQKQPVPDSSPQAYTELKIDAAVLPFLDSAKAPAVDGPVELSEAIAHSPKANGCFVKQLATFVAGRPLTAQEVTRLHPLTDQMLKGASLRSVMSQVVLQQVVAR